MLEYGNVDNERTYFRGFILHINLYLDSNQNRSIIKDADLDLAISRPFYIDLYLDAVAFQRVWSLTMKLVVHGLFSAALNIKLHHTRTIQSEQVCRVTCGVNNKA